MKKLLIVLIFSTCSIFAAKENLVYFEELKVFGDPIDGHMYIEHEGHLWRIEECYHYSEYCGCNAKDKSMIEIDYSTIP